MKNFDKYKVTVPYGKYNTPEGKLYREEESRLMKQFKQDMFEELGIENNPKREILFRIAWEYGHSYGLHEVFSYAEELVELII